VKPQGSLFVNLQGAIDLDLSTENEHCNKVELSLESSDASESKLNSIFNVTEDGKGGAEISVDSRGLSGLKVTGLIPEKFSLIGGIEGNAQIARLEGRLELSTKGGSIKLDKVSEGDCKLKSNGGQISARVLNCDVEIDTVGGAFNCKRVAGIRFKLLSNGGSVDIRALYANHIEILESGDIAIGSVHGQTKLTTKGGQVVVESGMDGEIEIQTNGGKADLQIGSSARKVAICSDGGDAHLRLPADLDAQIEAKGRRGVLVDDSLKNFFEYEDAQCKHAKGRITAREDTTSGARGYTPTSATVNIDAGHGFVELRSKDWLSSLGSKFQALRDLKE